MQISTQVHSIYFHDTATVDLPFERVSRLGGEAVGYFITRDETRRFEIDFELEV